MRPSSDRCTADPGRDRPVARLRLRPPAPRDARADPALRRPDGARGTARHAVLAAAHARARRAAAHQRARCARSCSTARRCRATSIRWSSSASSRSCAGTTRARGKSRSRAPARRRCARREPHWKRAQKEVAQRVGADKLDALIETLGELESLHPAWRGTSRRPSPPPDPGPPIGESPLSPRHPTVAAMNDFDDRARPGARPPSCSSAAA